MGVDMGMDMELDIHMNMGNRKACYFPPFPLLLIVYDRASALVWAYLNKIKTGWTSNLLTLLSFFFFSSVKFMKHFH
jgi:hypothetical protein